MWIVFPPEATSAADVPHVLQMCLSFWSLFQESLTATPHIETADAPVPGNEWQIALQIFGELIRRMRGKCVLLVGGGGWMKDQSDKFRVYRNDVRDVLVTASVHQLSPLFLSRHDPGLTRGLFSQVLRPASRDVVVPRQLVSFGSVVANGTAVGGDRGDFALSSRRSGGCPDRGGRLPPTGVLARDTRPASDDGRQSDARNNAGHARYVPFASHAHLGRLRRPDHSPRRFLAGDYSSWFHSHPTHVISAIGYIVPALEVPSLCTSAAQALKTLCDLCRTSLTGHISEFGSLYVGVEDKINVRPPPNRSFATEPDRPFFSAPRVQPDEKAKVLEAITSVVQALPPLEAVQPVKVRFP